MNSKDIQGLIDRMPLEKKVGQLFILAFPGKDVKEIESLITDYGIGGCYISQDNAETFIEAKELTNSLNSLSEIPMLVGVDQEGAWGVLVPYSATGPGNLALGATKNLDIIRDMYKVYGYEMGEVGYNTILGPCADINLRPDNPIIDTRSFGEDPLLVSQCVKAAVEGLYDSNSISTAKHFPGHGDTSGDSHREIPVVDKSLETLLEYDLMPFQAAIDSGVDIIMTSHIKYPQIDNDNPATFSKKILGSILRERMGFKGLILSDSMNMGAIRRYYKPEDSAVLALNAGVDLVMLSEEHYDHSENYKEVQIETIKKLINYVKEGKIKEEKIDSILYRVLEFKSRKGLLSKSSKKNSLNYKDIEYRAAKESVSLLKDEAGRWPLDLKSTIFVNTTPRDLYSKIMNPRGIGPNQSKPAFDTLKEELKGSYSQFIDYEEYNETLFQYGNIILVTEDYPLPGEDFTDKRVDSFISKVIESHGDKVGILGLRSPYDLIKFSDVNLYLSTYSSRTISVKAISEIIESGEVPKGHSILTLVD